MFKPITDLDDRYAAVKFAICGYEAVDTENQLALFTTNGRVKHKRKWYVQRYTLPGGRRDSAQPFVMFRATPGEVMQRLAEPAIQQRIAALVKALEG